MHWSDVEYEAFVEYYGLVAAVVVLLEGRSEEVDPDTVILDPCWWEEKRLFGKKPRMEHVEHFFNKNLEGLLRQ